MLTSIVCRPVGWGGGGGGYIGMCSPKEYGLLAILVIYRVLILAEFGHFSHK